jgi:beta-N-acetylhexosaminidase
MSTHTLSRRDFLRMTGQGLAATMVLAGCRASLPGTSIEETPPTDTPTPPPTVTPAQGPTSGASLEIKIGQMLMIGFRGLEVNDDHLIVRDIRERGLGGVVLFDYDVPGQSLVRNVESPAQVQALVGLLQAASDIPLLVAIDHEGGVLTRLKEEHSFPPTLSHQALGEIDDPAFTREQTAAMAQTLAGLGINLNLAPVVDLNLNPGNPIIARYERSFSADPEAVTRHAIAFIEAHHEQGVRCALKHFPGHGSSTGDTHEGWVDVTDTWSRLELEPFANIIEVGRADAIMTAHVFNAKLDADDPATLSRPTITTILREELGYDGVVISDDMQMAAITDHYGFEAAVRKAIEAGVDILAFANNSVYEEDVASRAVALVKRLVEEGSISEARIDASYRRIRRLKNRLTAT